MNRTPHLLDTRLAQVGRRRAAERTLRTLAPALTLALAVASVAVILVRLAAPQLADHLGWAVVAATVAPAALLPRALRRPPAAHLAADLDLLAHGDGLVMALAAQAPTDRDPAWTERLMRRLEAVVLPPLPWRALAPPLVAAAALAGAFALPQRLPEPPRERPPVAGFFDEARRTLEALNARGLLPEAQRAELERRLERLEAEAVRAGMTQATWDGLDRVEEQARAAASQATRRLAEALIAAERARGLSVEPPPTTTPEEVDPAGPDDPPKGPGARSRLNRKSAEPPPDPGAAARQRRRLLERLTRESDREALRRFAQGLGELAEAAPDLMPRLDEAMLDELDRLLEALEREGALSPQRREAVRRAAGAAGQGAARSGGGAPPRSGGVRPMTQEDLDRLVEALRQRLQDRADGLSGTDDGQRLTLLLEAMRRSGGSPGRDGGPAPLTRDDRPTGSAGQAATLPPGLPDEGDGSVTLAVEHRAPELDDAARRDLVRAAARQMDPARADARRAHVAPRHKGVVGRYFGADDAPEPE